MTRVLLDTNVVLRLLEKGDPQHAAVRAAVERCVASGREPCLAPQVVVEFWVVATRPREANGLGWDPPTARDAVDGLVSLFPILPDVPDVKRAQLEAVLQERAWQAIISS